jgi:perosamine synthetase
LQLPLARPDITDLEIEYVNKVLRTPVLSIGPMVEQFESRLAEYVGCKYAIAVNSGTSRLHTCVIASGIEAGDRVITSPFSFVASANCILYERAIPVFVDIDSDTLNIDPQKADDKVVEGWDSCNHLNLVFALEERFDIRFSTQEMGAMANVGDLFVLLNKHGVEVEW